MQSRVLILERQLAEREKLIQHLSVTVRDNEFDSEHRDSKIDISAETLSPSPTSLPRTQLSQQVIHRSRVPINTNPNLTNELSVPTHQRIFQLQSQPSLLALVDDHIDCNIPRLVNLNQDPLFSECILYYLPASRVTSTFVVTSNADAVLSADDVSVDNAIVLTGPDIQLRHCRLTNCRNTVTIVVYQDGDPLVCVNGKKVRRGDAVVLKRHDRVAIGRFHIFRYEAAESVPSTGFQPGWEFAQEELQRGFLSNSNNTKTEMTSRITDSDRSTQQQSTRPTSTVLATSSIGTSSFESEALQLQRELAEMQKSLQDRMKRYQRLTAPLP